MGKVSNTNKKEFSSELVYNKKYLKVGQKINTKEGFQCICAQVILVDSVYRKSKNYYPEVFLEKAFIEFHCRRKYVKF